MLSHGWQSIRLESSNRLSINSRIQWGGHSKGGSKDMSELMTLFRVIAAMS